MRMAATIGTGHLLMAFAKEARAADVDWLSVDNTAVHTEARTDRFVAAMTRSEGDALEFSVAYTMRAVSPGTFAQPGATVEDMYRPELFARTAAGKVEVVGPTR